MVQWVDGSIPHGELFLVPASAPQRALTILYVGWCICMYACMYVCMYACMYVCMYVCVCVCVCMYACMYMSGCIYVCMYIRYCSYTESSSRSGIAGFLFGYVSDL